MYTNLDLKTVPKRATETELAHTDVLVGGRYVGYYMPNRSQLAAVNENWNFVSGIMGLQHFHSKTRNELYSTLLKQMNNENVVLNQNFGVKLELNPTH